MRKATNLLILLLPAIGWSISGPHLAKPNFSLTDSLYSGLPSNGVTQIALQGDSLIWLATGGGLSRTSDFGATIVSYYSGMNNLPRGGISAIAVRDSIIWVAGVFDSNTVKGEMQTGGGLAYSRDNGQTWHFVAQPIDAADDRYGLWDGDRVEFLPIVTPVNNTTWDIALTDDYAYIVSWAGGIRRTKDWGKTWERLVLPPDGDDRLECGEPITFKVNPRDPPEGNHNHKGFSVLAYNDTVWVGTANGINLGIVESTDCIRWRKYTARNSAISGNFVVALGRQLYKGQETIWAVTLPAEGAGEYQAVSKTSDGGLTWSTTLVGERAYSFAFDDSIAYVCTDRGLFKSIDSENWAVYTPIADTTRQEYIYSQHAYAAEVDKREGVTYLWVGTGDGLAKTRDDGLHWRVYRTSLSTADAGQPDIYAYPNPFSPTHHNILNGDGHVRIQYNLTKPALVMLEVFNFAMERVYRSEWFSIPAAGDYNLPWNGRASNGEIVANGVYFCKLTRRKGDKDKEFWTKLIVVK